MNAQQLSEAQLLFTHALSPLHAGTGQGVGAIDLPVVREKATGLPYLPGSSLKGTLRDAFPADTDQEKQMKIKIFGPETTHAEEHAGAVQISDQRLLLLPIRSLVGTFAWVTSPYILRRLKRDVEGLNVNALPLTIPSPQATQNAEGELQERCAVVSSTTEAQCKLIYQTLVVLEDLDLLLDNSQSASSTEWAKWIAKQVFPKNEDLPWRTMLAERFCVVSDEVMSFLLETATEITARIKLLDDAKTVQKGGLWYEESLPIETILYGLVVPTPNEKTNLTRPQILQEVRKAMGQPLQLGGKATVGRGLCRLSMPAPPQNGKGGIQQ